MARIQELTRFHLQDKKCSTCGELMVWEIRCTVDKEQVIFKCINSEKNCPQYGKEEVVVIHYFKGDENGLASQPSDK